MSELDAMRALSPETKALVLVSEFELRRMPAFQLRAVLDVLAPDAEERKFVVDMAERSLRESGQPYAVGEEGRGAGPAGTQRVLSRRRVRRPGN